MHLLIHTCCGPCLVYILDYYVKSFAKITLFFCNPNIQPSEEYERRLDSVQKLISHYRNFNGTEIVLAEKILDDSFFAAQGGKCDYCYDYRLSALSEYYVQNKDTSPADCFTTSLLISPYQKHDLIRRICEEKSAEHNLKFLYEDFRPFFRTGQQMAKDLGLYRQKYCGCVFSNRQALAK
jgi:predicted adenine nucleotide alpha hydrolase (AANH) superfamily ATPase